jgi:hypothetical protein
VAGSGECGDEPSGSGSTELVIPPTQKYFESPTGGLLPISDPKPFVTRFVKLFVNLLLVARSSFILVTLKDVKKSLFLPRLLLYLQVPPMLLVLKPHRKM